jgi:hypothetical protein
MRAERVKEKAKDFESFQGSTTFTSVAETRNCFQQQRSLMNGCLQNFFPSW